MSKPKIKYKDLQKQVIDEIQVLLEIEDKILEDYEAGKTPSDPVDNSRIEEFQVDYRATGPEESEGLLAGTRRARISC